MTVSILDNSFQAIKCIVALQSEDVSDFISGHAVCYISDTVSLKEKDQQLCKCHHSLTRKEYHIQRLGKRVHANGTGKFRLSLFEVSADQDYIVTLNLDRVLDNEAVECVARANRCITLIETEITVEQNKYPPLMKYEGKFTSEQLNKLVTNYVTPSFEGKIPKTGSVDHGIILGDSEGADDEMMLLNMLQFTDKPHAMRRMRSITQSENECPPPNDSLLQAIFWMHLSLVHSLQGEHDEALKHAEQARLMCSNVAPSPVTFSIYFSHVRILVRKYNSVGNMGNLLKDKILYCFDIAIQHSYKLIGSEENLMMIVKIHVYKALFCLTGVCTMDSVPPIPQYKPDAKDMSLATHHLDIAPTSLIPDRHELNILYFLLKSDLYRLNELEEGSLVMAQRYAKRAKQLCCETERLSIAAVIDGRLQLLNEIRLNIK